MPADRKTSVLEALAQLQGMADMVTVTLKKAGACLRLPVQRRRWRSAEAGRVLTEKMLLGS